MAFYHAMVDAAAERAADTGSVDLVSLAEAGEAGFDVSTFQADVERVASEIAAITHD